MGQNRDCNHHFTLHNSPSYSEGYRSWMAAASRTFCPRLCQGFLRLFLVGGLHNIFQGQLLEQFDPTGYTGFVFGCDRLDSYIFFLQCFYQFAFSFMHYIQMLFFVVVFLFSWIVDIWKLLPAGLGEGDGHGSLAFPDLSYSALLGTLVLICRAWCMTV